MIKILNIGIGKNRSKTISNGQRGPKFSKILKNLEILNFLILLIF